MKIPLRTEFLISRCDELFLEDRRLCETKVQNCRWSVRDSDAVFLGRSVALLSGSVSSASDFPKGYM